MSNELAKYVVVIDETVSCFAVICIQKKISACLQLTNMIYCYMQLCAFDCLSFIIVEQLAVIWHMICMVISAEFFLKYLLTLPCSS